MGTTWAGVHLGEIRAEVQEPMSSGGLPMKFPMWLIPGSVLARLEHPLLPHETLLQQGKLVRWEPGHPRKVVFISHEWLGTYHPDPDFKQFKVLQLALENLRKGLARVRKDTVSELLRIPLPMPSDAEQRNCLDWDFWYDYISCPQLSVASDMEVTMEEMSASKGELADAIASIPAYCDKADYTIVLAPSLLHNETQKVLSTSSWGNVAECVVLPLPFVSRLCWKLDLNPLRPYGRAEDP